ncbi:MAG TPA: hypothetical protein VF463_15045 [Sphingobium sp.]
MSATYKMTHSLIERSRGYFPIFPEEWQKIGPSLTQGLDADYLLIDPGPVVDEVRYMIVELRRQTYKLHFADSLTDVHACASGGLGIRSSLLVPLGKTRHRHLSHIGALFRADRIFIVRDMDMLNIVADRLLSFLDRP